jgi:hypothetical protein
MIREALLFALMAGPALCEGTLEGRVVTFSVLAYDDPAKPIFVGQGKTVQVGKGVEFGLDPEGAQNGVDVAPVTVDIGPGRVEVQFREGPGVLLVSEFNGYLLRFETDCALFNSVRIDPAATNMDLKPEDITTDTGTLYINMSGLPYSPESRFAVDIDVTDCPLS